MNGRLTQFDADYSAVISEILQQSPTTNTRTGKRVKAIHGVHLKTRPGEFPILNLRDIKPMWSCVEAVWFIAGGDSVDFMRKFGFKNWDAFADQDGKALSATGFRWRKAFNVDQLSLAVAKLLKDPTTRQAVLVSWVPQWDLVAPGANVPCIIAWHVEILGGALHMAVMQRSADMFFGLPHDILGFRIIQEFIAAALGAEVGTISYHISNAHLYEDQWYAGLIMLSRTAQSEVESGAFKFKIGRLEWQEALLGNERIPQLLHNQLAGWYRPWPPIRGPQLVK